MVEDAKRTLAYICPACRQSVAVERSVFQLAAASSELPCPCGKSSLKVELMGDRVRLTVPCLFCGRDHTVTCSSRAFLHERVLAFSCAASGLDCCYVGEEGPVFAALKRLEEAVDKLEELLDNIVEMYCCPRQTQYVGKQPQTTKAIRLRLDKLTSQHVEYIFDVMSNTTQPIKNIMAYLRTTILNAPTTMEHYYQAQGNWLTAQSRKK